MAKSKSDQEVDKLVEEANKEADPRDRVKKPKAKKVKQPGPSASQKAQQKKLKKKAARRKKRHKEAAKEE